MSIVQEKMYMDVDDVWAILGVSKAYAYNLMREYNKELKANDQMYMYRQSRISNHQKGHKKHRISTVRSVRYILFYDSRKLEFTVLPSFPSSAP